MNYMEEELDILKDLKKYKKNNGKNSLLKEWDKKVLSLNSPAISAFFAKLDGKCAKEHAEIVLKSGNLDAIFELSEKYPEHLEYILNSHDFEYNFKIVKRLFEEGIKGPDVYCYITPFSFREQKSKEIKNHIESISKSRETDNLVSFLDWYFQSMKRKDEDYGNSIGINLLQDSIIYINPIINKIALSNDAEKLYEAFRIISFAQYESGYNYKNKIDYSKLRDAIVKTENAECNYNVINNYKFERTKKEFLQHDEAIIKSKNPKFNYLMAIDGYYSNDFKPDISRHLEAVLKSKDPYYNLLCLENIPKANKAEHLRVIAESKDLEFNYRACLLGLENGSLNKFVVIESENLKYIFELASRFPDDPFFDIYVDVIKKSGNKKYIEKLNDLRPFMIADINEKIKKIKKV